MADLNEPHIAEASRAAIETRARLGLSADGPVDRDLLTLIEQELDIPVSILMLPEGVAGAYLRKRERGFVFIQAEHYPTRQRFTLAHELGHHVLEHHTRVENSDEVGMKTKDPNEQQANYFASEFLIPASTARSWIGEHASGDEDLSLEVLIRVAFEYHVSPPAFLYRLTTCGLEREHSDRLWRRIKKNEHIELSEELQIEHGDDQISLAYTAGDWPRLPQKLRGMAERARASGFIDAQRLTEVLRESA
jgi:Zn-dependent peptidase ImmA (M78 family)